MRFGAAVKLDDVDAGRVLIRSSPDESYLLLTTDDMNERGHRLCVSLSQNDSFNGLIRSSSLSEDNRYWDVTEFCEFRPDLTSHIFLDGSPRHGEIICDESGKLILVGEESSAVFFDVATGYREKPHSLNRVVRFNNWNLAAVDKRSGEEMACLFTWDRDKESRRGVHQAPIQR